MRALYKGCTTLIVGSIGKDAVRFVSFDSIKNGFKDADGTLTPLNNMLAGMCAGIAASIFAVTPTERIKTALIDDARHARRFTSPWHAVRVIYAEDGLLRGIYAGFGGNTLKQMSATAFRMGTYNILKDYERTRGIQQSTATNFANGMVAGIVTTYSTMPFDVIKTRCQASQGIPALQAIKDVWADGGIKEFWRGTTMRLGRTIFSGGILFTVYEEVAAIIDPMFRTVVNDD